MKLLNWFSNRPLILVVLATLFWAGNAVAGKIAVGHISPFLLTSLRWLVALTVLMPFAFNHLRSDWQKVRPRLVVLLLLGTVGFTLFNNLMYSALAITSAINVAIIQSSLPLFVFVVNALFFAMTVNRCQAIGFPITLVGVLTITFQGQVSLLFEQQLNTGDVLMLLAVIAYGVYSVFLSKKPDVHWLSTMTVLACGALIASVPFVVFEVLAGELVIPDLTGMSVVLYAAIFASIGAQAFWIRSVELIGANATSMFINLVPFFGALLAVMVLGEQLYAFHIIGFSMIVSGIYVAQLNVAQARHNET
jgi:drug/metabolite transporter (DMT)-like permease